MQQKRRKKKSIATSKKQFSKRAFIKATEDIKAQYHVHQNKSQQQIYKMKLIKQSNLYVAV